MSSTRRNFLASAAALGAAAPLSAASAARVLGANDRIRFALIGCGGMGRANLNECARHADVVVTAESVDKGVAPLLLLNPEPEQLKEA